MTPREGFRSFLLAHGWGTADVLPLAGDASFRRYFRVMDRGRRAVLMDAPADKEDSAPFIQMADFLVGAGFSAPRLLAADLVRGFLLLEDFGDRLVGPELAAARADEEAVYAAAIDLLVQLHRLDPPTSLQPYGREELLREVCLFTDWYAPAAGLSLATAPYVAAWDAVWDAVIAQTRAAPVVVLRDYHAENLMLLDDRPGIRGLGLLDFQDALAGHRAYDLVSLLQDARRDVPVRTERAMIGRFVGHGGVADPQAFRAAYAVLGAQRSAKILGIFVRLRDRDGRAGYVEKLPRVWRYLERDLASPALGALRAWFDAHVPAAAREAWCAR